MDPILSLKGSNRVCFCSPSVPKFSHQLDVLRLWKHIEGCDGLHFKALPGQDLKISLQGLDITRHIMQALEVFPAALGKGAEDLG